MSGVREAHRIADALLGREFFGRDLDEELPPATAAAAAVSVLPVAAVSPAVTVAEAMVSEAMVAEAMVAEAVERVALTMPGHTMQHVEVCKMLSPSGLLEAGASLQKELARWARATRPGPLALPIHALTLCLERDIQQRIQQKTQSTSVVHECSSCHQMLCIPMAGHQRLFIHGSTRSRRPWSRSDSFLSRSCNPP